MLAEFTNIHSFAIRSGLGGSYQAPQRVLVLGTRMVFIWVHVCVYVCVYFCVCLGYNAYGKIEGKKRKEVL